jgi:hypothetical protein
MVETAAGHRVLIAPTRDVADFVAATYTFDEVRAEDIAVTGPDMVWQVTSRSLSLTLGVGERTLVGRMLSLVPERVATHPAWASAADPFSRVVLRGVRTRGAAGPGRREWYGATDVRAVTRMQGPPGQPRQRDHQDRQAGRFVDGVEGHLVVVLDVLDDEAHRQGHRHQRHRDPVEPLRHTVVGLGRHRHPPSRPQHGTGAAARG